VYHGHPARVFAVVVAVVVVPRRKKKKQKKQQTCPYGHANHGQDGHATPAAAGYGEKFGET
jgi:hypothetical protein